MSGLFKPGFEIWRPARSFSNGAVTETFALSSTVEGRLSPLSGGEEMRAEQERGVIGLRFSTPAATDVVKGDQVRVDGRRLEVKAVRITSSGRRKECVCEEVQE